MFISFQKKYINCKKHHTFQGEVMSEAIQLNAFGDILNYKYSSAFVWLKLNENHDVPPYGDFKKSRHLCNVPDLDD